MKRSRYLLALVAILWLALALRMAWTKDPGYVIDVSFFARWMRSAARDGVAGILSTDSSYPPASVYALWALGLLSDAGANAPNTPPTMLESLALQVSIVFCDLLTVALLATMGRRTSGARIGLLAALLYALCPGGIYLAGWWRQIDAWLILPMLLAGWWLSKKRIVPAWAALGIAVTVKLQALLLVPVFVVGTWRWCGLRATFKGALVLLLAVAVVVAPLLIGGYGAPLWAKMTQPTRELQWISLSSHNLWYVLTARARDVGRTVNRDQQAFVAGISFHDAGLALLALGYALLLGRLWLRSRPDDIFSAIALAWFTLFMVTTRMHVRYIYPALVFLLCAGFHKRRWWGLYAVAAITLLCNLVLKSYTTSPLAGLVPLTPEQGVWNAWIHVGVLVVFWGMYLAPLRSRSDETEDMHSAQGWELWLLFAGGLAVCGGVLLVLWQGRVVGRELAQLREPLVQSLDAAMNASSAMNNTSPHTLVVNWPGAILAGESANLLGVVPITPPALFLDSPDLVERPADWVQFVAWQRPFGWNVEYYGTHVTVEDLASLLHRSERVVALQPETQTMYVLSQISTPSDPATCTALFAEKVCLSRAQVQAQTLPTATLLILELTWQVDGQVSPDETVFVHVLDASGALAAQADGDLVLNLLPLADLPTVASALTETRTALVPPSNDYRVHVGLYNRTSGERMPPRCAPSSACVGDALEVYP